MITIKLQIEKSELNSELFHAFKQRGSSTLKSVAAHILRTIETKPCDQYWHWKDYSDADMASVANRCQITDESKQPEKKFCITFDDQQSAEQAAGDIFDRTGVVVGITHC